MHRFRDLRTAIQRSIAAKQLHELKSSAKRLEVESKLNERLEKRDGDPYDSKEETTSHWLAARGFSLKSDKYREKPYIQSGTLTSTIN